jgi:DNA polymerase III alpha subunit
MKTEEKSVLKYVVNKYGHDKVAHIITFGSMAAKMAIRDVAGYKNYLCLMPTGLPSLYLKDQGSHLNQHMQKYRNWPGKENHPIN